MNDLQRRILNIFKAVTEMCAANGITYFAVGGTALGAVRHKGFIPWDDDLDIAVPIEQYDRFIETARRELPPQFIVMTPDDMVHYASTFIKVVDAGTTFIERKAMEFPDSYYGVFIDIMPLAGVPDPGKGQKKYLRWWKRTAMLNYARRFPLSRMKTRSRVAACRMMMPFHSRIPFNYFTDKIFAEYRRHPFFTSSLTGYVWSVRLPRFIYDVGIFGEGVMLPFEDTMINCPVQTDRYLTLQFGDYMTLPPEEKRTCVHSAFVDLEHPFADYKEGRRTPH